MYQFYYLWLIANILIIISYTSIIEYISIPIIINIIGLIVFFAVDEIRYYHLI